MFFGELLTRANRCAMCHKDAPRMRLRFYSRLDEDHRLFTEYELVESNNPQSACKECWKKLGLYITSSLTRTYRIPKRRLELIEFLKKSPNRTADTHIIAQSLYGKRDLYSIQKVAKLVLKLRERGYNIEHHWGGSYTLVSEPEIPTSDKVEV